MPKSIRTISIVCLIVAAAAVAFEVTFSTDWHNLIWFMITISLLVGGYALRHHIRATYIYGHHPGPSDSTRLTGNHPTSPRRTSEDPQPVLAPTSRDSEIVLKSRRGVAQVGDRGIVEALAARRCEARSTQASFGGGRH